MNNLRIVERQKSVGDTYGTGDHQSITVFDIVRDYDESDIWDKEKKRGNDPAAYYTKEVIEKGNVITTVSSQEFAQYILNGLKAKQNEKAIVYILFGKDAGRDFIDNKKVTEEVINNCNRFEFNSEPEALAYLKGLRDMNGWMDYNALTPAQYHKIQKSVKKEKAKGSSFEG